MSRKKVMILAIDGGGIRGLIPAVVLRTLESLIEGPLSSHFDLMAGTSTGSLIALGLAAPAREEAKYLNRPAFSAADVVDIYLKNGEKIFPRSWAPSTLRTMGQAFGEKYDSRGIDDALEEIFGPLTLQDGLTNLLIPACRTETGSPLFFKKRPPRFQWRDDENFLMRDAARGSTAAPTYFPPAYVCPLNNLGQPKQNGYTLVDGGLVANNPALCAYVEARKIYPHAKEFVILSLGTGRLHPSYEYAEVRKWGYLDWVNPARGTPLWSLMTSSQSQSVRHQLYKLPGIEYIRINGNLGTASPDMDDASPENLDHLVRTGERIIDENGDRLDRLIGFLE